MLLGAIVNALTIIVGGLLGTYARHIIPERHSKLIMTCLQIVVATIGIKFAISTDNVLVVIISLAIGALIGESIDLDRKMQQLGECIQKRLKSKEHDVAAGFVTTTLIYCVGSMAILASIDSGMKGEHDIHFTKAIIDGIAAIFFASSMGIGVALSGISVLLYQGALTLLANVIAPYLGEAVMTEMSATGGVMLIALAMSMLEIKQIKVANLLPALFVSVLLMLTGWF
ncbi:MAG: DUF554 domain-containing protein [Peptostreptococcaceae bacterium]|nr:DUF554 domain-containing protein [Peptostreptococcaceae bacterium]